MNNQFPDGVGVLADLSDQTRQARSSLEDLEQKRDKKIVELLQEGHSTRELATATGLTQARVVQIHSKARAARNTPNHPIVDGGGTA
jgi:hypothetical protein